MKLLSAAAMLALVAGAPTLACAQAVQRVQESKDVETLEDAATSYFRQVAYLDRNSGKANVQGTAKEMLRDRDGLTDAQADEVIAIARKFDAPQSAQMRTEDARATRIKACSDLTESKTTDEKIAVLEGIEAHAQAENRLEGARLLTALTPATRSAVNKALVEYRKGGRVGRNDWSRAKPEQMEAYKNNLCAAAY